MLVALIFSLISLIFIFLFEKNWFSNFSVFIIIIGFKCVGNVTPISWAAIADIQKKEFRFALAIATAPYALGYLILNFFSNTLANFEADIITLILFIVLILVIFGFFRDLKDKKESNSKDTTLTLRGYLSLEIKSIKQDLLNEIIRNGLVAYLFWAITLYSVLILLADFKTPYHNNALIMMYGYLVGVIILKFCKKIQDDTIIYLGYIVTWVPLLAFFTLYYFLNHPLFLLGVCSFFFGMANAYFSPTIFAILSKEKHTHEQGRIFGLIESSDTLGFAISIIAVLVSKIFSIPIFYLVILSALAFLISWIPYSKNRSLRKNRHVN